MPLKKTLFKMVFDSFNLSQNSYRAAPITDRETANAIPVVAHMYGVIVSKNLRLYDRN